MVTSGKQCTLLANSTVDCKVERGGRVGRSVGGRRRRREGEGRRKKYFSKGGKKEGKTFNEILLFLLLRSRAFLPRPVLFVVFPPSRQTGRLHRREGDGVSPPKTPSRTRKRILRDFLLLPRSDPPFAPSARLTNIRLEKEPTTPLEDLRGRGGGSFCVRSFLSPGPLFAAPSNPPLQRTEQEAREPIL